MHTYYDTLFDYDHTHTLKSLKESEPLIDTMMPCLKTYTATDASSATMHWIEAEKILVDNATFVHSPLNRMHKDPVLLKTFSAIGEKSEALFIQSPYIIFSKQMLEYFPDYETKDLTVLTNNIDLSTNYFAMSGYVRYKDSINAHARLYEYQGDTTIHAKTLTFDENISVIGSFNLDPRSATLSTESAIVIVSETFKSELDSVIDTYMTKSLEVNDEGGYIDNPEVHPTPINDTKRFKIRLRSFITRFFDPML